MGLQYPLHAASTCVILQPLSPAIFLFSPSFDALPFDPIGLLLTFGFLLWIRCKKVSKSTPLIIPVSQLFPTISSCKKQAALLSSFLGKMAPIFLFIALLNPKVSVPPFLLPSKNLFKPPPPTEGQALLLLVDVSGSMKESYGENGPSKINITKQALERLVHKLTGEQTAHLLGVMDFARAAFVQCPLTYDEQAILHAVEALQPVTSDVLNGTSQGYAIFKGTTQILALEECTKKYDINPSFRVKDRALLMWTDGIEDINPLDREDPFRSMRILQALDQAKSAGVRVYFVLCEPALDTMRYKDHLQKLSKAVIATGGNFYLATNAFSPDQIIDDLLSHNNYHLPPTRPLTPHIPLRTHALLTALFLLTAKYLLDIWSPVLQ